MSYCCLSLSIVPACYQGIGRQTCTRDPRVLGPSSTSSRWSREARKPSSRWRWCSVFLLNLGVLKAACLIELPAGYDLIGLQLKSPLAWINDVIYALPMVSILTDKGTRIVTSVPSSIEIRCCGTYRSMVRQVRWAGMEDIGWVLVQHETVFWWVTAWIWTHIWVGSTSGLVHCHLVLGWRLLSWVIIWFNYLHGLLHHCTLVTQWGLVDLQLGLNKWQMRFVILFFTCGPYSESSCISSPILKNMKEFEYWYPLNLRVSGKDLIQNHLTFLHL